MKNLNTFANHNTFDALDKVCIVTGGSSGIGLALINELQSRKIIVRNLDVPQDSGFYQVKSYVEYRLSEKSNFGVGVSYQKAEDYYDGIILRANINNSFNSRLTMRTKIQYSDFSNSWFIEPMITYQPNAFSALYFGVNDLLETEDGIISNLTESKRQIFIKFQYLF